MRSAGRPRLVVSIALVAALGLALPARAAEHGDPAAPPPVPSESQTAEAEAADLSLNPLATFDKAALEAFRETPLFTPSRRRPAPPAVTKIEAPPPPSPAVEPPPKPPSLKLSGVVQGPEGSVAFVRNEAEGGRVEQLRLGDQIGGWLVIEIGAGSLKLTLDDRDQDYRLFERQGASAAASEESGTESDAPRGKAQDVGSSEKGIGEDRRRTTRPEGEPD